MSIAGKESSWYLKAQAEKEKTWERGYCDQWMARKFTEGPQTRAGKQETAYWSSGKTC